MGTRRGFVIFVSGWSLVDVMHSFARTAHQFIFCRFLLGLVEPVNFPAGVKAVSEWFPVQERALAIGIFNSGTALGAGIAAPIVAWVTLYWGWRYTFLVGAALGATWVILWGLIYRAPGKHPWITSGELNLIEAGEPTVAAAKRVSTLTLLKMPETRGCILARMLTDPITYFFAFWAPKFLQQERGFDLKAIGRFSWIPFVGLALGNLAGGAIPAWMVRRGATLDGSRKRVMFVASCMIPVCFVLITRVPTPAAAIACLTLAMFFHASWANITLPAEVFEKGLVGSVSGFGGAMGSLVGAVTMLVIGRTVSVSSFTPVFIIYSALPMTAFALVCLWVKDLGRLRGAPGTMPVHPPFATS
jgi:ACS family hexuronate transporter-like MFS transporter